MLQSVSKFLGTVSECSVDRTHWDIGKIKAPAEIRTHEPHVVGSNLRWGSDFSEFPVGSINISFHMCLSSSLSLAILFAGKLSHFGKTTLWEGKVLESVSTILSEDLVLIDITGVVSAQVALK